MGYPDDVDDLETLTGGTDPDTSSLFAEAATGKPNSTLQNEARDAIRAVRAHLGDNPAGRFADLQARLAAADVTATTPQRGLHRFHQALAGRADAPVRILCLGDSRTEGSSSSSPPDQVDELEDRWVYLLQKRLREAFATDGIGDGGGFGYLPVHYASSNLDGLEPARSGTVTLISDGGPGLRDAALGATGPGTVTWDVHGTSVDIWWVGSQDSGKLEYDIDSAGSWTEINTDDDAPDVLLHNHLTHVALGDSDDHQIAVRHKSQGTGGAPTPRVAGVWVYDGDETAGIQVMEAAHSGFQVSNFAAAQYANQIAELVTLFEPDLVLIDLGTNDWNNGVALDDYQADLETLIGLLRDGDDELEVVLIGGWEPIGDLGDPIATFREYVDRMYAVAAADRVVSVCDLLDYLPDADQAAAEAGDLYDLLALHPDVAGHAAIADALLEHIRPRPGSLSDGPDGYADVDVTDSVTDVGATPLDLGTDGYVTLRYRITNGVCEGWLILYADDDATFGGTDTFIIPEESLPGDLVAPPDGFYWPGSFGYVVDVGGVLNHVGAVPTVIDLGGGNNPLTLIRVDPTGPGGFGSLFSFTGPDDFTGTPAKYLAEFRYPVA